jgi:murein DD-endopeptidase MepM/ murein hydrolase activator NlpD
MMQKQRVLSLLPIVVVVTAALALVLIAGYSHEDMKDGKGGFESPEALVFADDTLAFELASETEPDATPQPLSYTVYRVRKGDMIGPLAEEFGITQDTLISVNKIKNSRTIQIDQYLKVPPIPGILYTIPKDGEKIDDIAQRYEISPEKCVEVNHIQQMQELKAGTTLFLPDAKLDRATLQEINGDMFLWPLHRAIRISSYFSWRRSPFTGTSQWHNGLDLPAPFGTSIYAAYDGTVTAVSYNATYGNYIILTHRSGYRTLYGHMSSTLVSVGDYVWTDTVIGRVGSTGASTGPHLHFTVYKNGREVDPQVLLP